MEYIYVIVCFLAALLLPHLIVESAPFIVQFILQIAFIIVGIVGFRTLSE